MKVVISYFEIEFIVNCWKDRARKRGKFKTKLV